MIAQDDPQHLAQRRLVSRRFTPKAVRQLEPLLVNMIDGLLSPMVADLASGERGQTDAVTALAPPPPAQITAHLIVFPEETWPDIRTWPERTMRSDTGETDPEGCQGSDRKSHVKG